MSFDTAVQVLRGGTYSWLHCVSLWAVVSISRELMNHHLLLPSFVHVSSPPSHRELTCTQHRLLEDRWQNPVISTQIVSKTLFNCLCPTRIIPICARQVTTPMLGVATTICMNTCANMYNSTVRPVVWVGGLELRCASHPTTVFLLTCHLAIT